MEFLTALGNQRLIDSLKSIDINMSETINNQHIDSLKHYYYIGGMPEAVLSFSKNKNWDEVREIQNRILENYEQEFSKHAPNDIVPRLRMLFNSIPSQLAKENKKFIYGLIKRGARAREYEFAMQWLCDCGVAYKVHRVIAPQIPLHAYVDYSAFKLFIADVGLLSCMAGISKETLLDGTVFIRELNGALSEQYVLQQILTQNHLKAYYWSNERNTSEIDFLISDGSSIIPLEVMAEINLQSKSLKAFKDKFSPDMSVRAAMAEYKKEEWLLNLPLYAIETLSQQIAQW